MQGGLTITETIRIDDMACARALSGRQDEHLRRLRDALGVRVVLRGNQLTLAGDTEPVRRATKVIGQLMASLKPGRELSAEEVQRVIDAAGVEPTRDDGLGIEVMARDHTVRPRTPGQSGYIRAIAGNDIVFCTGPAGTGKTYLAVAKAVSALKANEVRKIILARPAVEAGERLGFLPGDLQAKVNPYLRPLYDALYDMVAVEHLRRYMENDVVEVAPLAYMRGRTLDHAFVILDEGQNCTRKQMKMFLTRLGSSSKAVVTGDISQTDLPPEEISGMMEASSILQGVKGIAFVALKTCDIVRHRLVQDIVDAYDNQTRAHLPEDTNSSE